MFSTEIKLLSAAILSAISGVAIADQQSDSTSKTTSKIEEVFVLSEATTYANSLVNKEMKDQQTTMTSVLAVIDNLPGVLINEGDVFGADDWSTTVSIRGFQLSLDEQQIGMTIDGIPNGGSNYGGGSKANRFVDTLNLETVRVSQGTADTSSRSHEALGGTLDFITQDPIDEERLRVNIASGDYNAKKFYARYDTGLIFGNTMAWISYSDSDVNDWIQETGEANRTHIAGKFITELDNLSITGYASYDDTHEDNYQRVTAAEFTQNSEWDRLTADWTGTPFIDQLYRKGWSTLRENMLAYVKFDFTINESLSLQVTPYYHDNEGRGDWLPPYIVEVTNDGTSGNSELVSGTTVRGGSALGRIGFVDSNGNTLTPSSNCQTSLTFPYGGTASSPDLDPACYASGAIPVGSYRHTHYDKERLGFTADVNWTFELQGIENEVRAGMWYEDQTRKESRDWHKIIDSRTSFDFDNTPYWIQYDREYPQETMMYYVEDVMNFGDLSVRLSGKQWFVDVERKDNFANANGSVSSDSDFLANAGVVWRLNDNIELFAGYAENFAAIKDAVLEQADLANNPKALDSIEPETSENQDIGIRYTSDRFNATATYYSVDFNNRITLLTADTVAGIDFLEEAEGEYRNVGGIESDGFELSATWFINDNWSLYSSYTNNDSTYLDFGTNQGNTVFGSVEDMYVISADWQKDQYRAGLTTKHVGERWMDAANTNRVGASDVADLYIAVVGEGNSELFKGYEVRFTVNNLFDESYIAGVAGGWGGWIGASRTAAVSLQLDF